MSLEGRTTSYKMIQLPRPLDDSCCCICRMFQKDVFFLVYRPFLCHLVSVLSLRSKLYILNMHDMTWFLAAIIC